MNGWLTLCSEPWIQRLGWVLIHFLWQGTGIALLLAVVLRLLTQAASHVRYAVIGSTLLLCATMPMVTWIVLGSQAQPVMQLAAVLNVTDVSKVEAPVALYLSPRPDTVFESPGNVQMRWQDNFSRWTNNSLPYIVSLWFVGVLILTLRLTLGWTLVQRLCGSGSAIQDSRCQERFHSLLERMQVGVPVRFLQSALVEVPTLIGWLRPTILVPVSVFTGLTPDQLEAILAHELAHVRRYDYLVNLFQTVIETILFYHPAIWWISHKLREERENCCDDIALEVMQDRLVYVSALAQLEEGRAIPLAMTASGGSLLQRIRRIAGANDRRVSAWPMGIVIIGILALVLLTQGKASETASTQAAREISISSTNPQPAVSKGITFEQELAKSRNSPDTAAKDSTPEANVQVLNAVKKGDTAALQKLLERGINPDAYKSNPVYWAVYYNQPAILKKLLDYHAEVNRWDPPGDKSPLELAKIIHPELASIIQDSADRNRQWHIARFTARLQSLHIDLPAFSQASLEKAVAALVAAEKKSEIPNPSINFMTPDSPVITAARITLVSQKNISVYNAFLAIAKAAGLRVVFDEDYIRILPPPSGTAVPGPIIAPSVKTPVPVKTTSLLQAVGAGDLKLVQSLLEQGVDPNAKGQWGTNHDLVARPIAWAVTDGNLEVAQFLLDHGAKADDYMAYALNMGNGKMVKLLWDHGVRSLSELSYQISQGASVEVLKGLLDRGSPTEPPQDTVMTPLAVSAAFGNKPALDLLLAHGADPNKCGVFAQDTWTRPDYSPSPDLLLPLNVAAENGQNEIVEDLLGHGVRPSRQAILSAVERSTVSSPPERSRDHFETTVKLLIDAGVLKNVPFDESGKILYLSIYYGGDANPSVLKMLLDAGLSPQSKYVDTQGKSLIDYVRDDYKQATPIRAAKLKPILDILEASDTAPTMMADPKIHDFAQADPTWKITSDETPLTFAQQSGKDMVPMLEEAIKSTQAPKWQSPLR